ncbi:hypothetical protein LJK87_35640 [Paenibacillus sp. P25]|nr:hypothetical protein LJK87_35640 [Paenibacillus sp. P25]
MRKRPAAAQRRAANGGIRLACTQERPRRFCWPPPRGIDAETSGSSSASCGERRDPFDLHQERPRRFCWPPPGRHRCGNVRQQLSVVRRTAGSVWLALRSVRAGSAGRRRAASMRKRPAAAQRRAANGGIHLTCTQERPRRFCWRLAAVG